jgi:hypothetical protein
MSYYLLKSQPNGAWREEYFISANFFLLSSCSFLLLWLFLAIHYCPIWSSFMFFRLCSRDFLLLRRIALLEELVCFLFVFFLFERRLSILYFYNSVEWLQNFPPAGHRYSELPNTSHFYYFFIWLNNPQWARAFSFPKFLDHTQRRNTVGRTPLDQWSARRRDFYLTTHNTPNRQTYMLPVEFELTSSTAEQPQTRLRPRDQTDRLMSSRICNKSSLAVST